MNKQVVQKTRSLEAFKKQISQGSLYDVKPLNKLEELTLDEEQKVRAMKAVPTGDAISAIKSCNYLGALFRAHQREVKGYNRKTVLAQMLKRMREILSELLCQKDVNAALDIVRWNIPMGKEALRNEESVLVLVHAWLLEAEQNPERTGLLESISKKLTKILGA